MPTDGLSEIPTPETIAARRGDASGIALANALARALRDVSPNGSVYWEPDHTMPTMIDGTFDLVAVARKFLAEASKLQR